MQSNQWFKIVFTFIAILIALRTEYQLQYEISVMWKVIPVHYLHRYENILTADSNAILSLFFLSGIKVG